MSLRGKSAAIVRGKEEMINMDDLRRSQSGHFDPVRGVPLKETSPTIGGSGLAASFATATNILTVPVVAGGQTRRNTIVDVMHEGENDENRRALNDKYLKRLRRFENGVWLVSYTIFLGIFLAQLFMARDVTSANEIINALRDTLIDEEFLFEDSQIPKNYLSVQQVSEFWQWLQGPLQAAITKSEWYNGESYSAKEEDYIYRYNRFVGGVRLRQLRVRETDCFKGDGPSNTKLRSIYPTCWPAYSEATSSVDAYGPGNKYTYTSPSESKLPTEVGRATNTKYSGGGFIQDISRANTSEIPAMLQALKDDLWIDKQTRVVFVTVNVFNGNLQQFVVANMMVEFSPGGWVYPYFSFSPFRLDPYLNAEDKGRAVLECVLVVFLAAFTWLEIKEMGGGESRTVRDNAPKKPWHTQLMNYFEKDMWNLLDVANLTIFWVVFIQILLYITNSERQNIDINTDDYVNLENIAGSYTDIYNNFAFNVLLTFFKTFKYLQVNQRLQVLWRTLGKAGKDLFAFIVFFSIVFSGFATMGHLLFGPDLFEFRDFLSSLMSCFRLVLGEFDYRELWRINRILGPFFFVLFIILVYFSLANMFIAIINESWQMVMEPIRAKEQRKRLLKEQKSSLLGGNQSMMELLDRGKDSAVVKFAKATWAKWIRMYRFIKGTLKIRADPATVTSTFFSVCENYNANKFNHEKIFRDRLVGYPTTVREVMWEDYEKIKEEKQMELNLIRQIEPGLRPLAESLCGLEDRMDRMEGISGTMKREMGQIKAGISDILQELQLRKNGGATTSESPTPANARGVRFSVATPPSTADLTTPAPNEGTFRMETKPPETTPGSGNPVINIHAPSATELSRGPATAPKAEDVAEGIPSNPENRV